ncbi:MAG: HAMP domain-containing histidine kinase [Coriobacteriales bacterium]|nr:HAMP domain-containing histidine kinase [Coriobacteriales bacterium]
MGTSKQYTSSPKFFILVAIAWTALVIVLLWLAASQQAAGINDESTTITVLVHVAAWIIGILLIVAFYMLFTRYTKAHTMADNTLPLPDNTSVKVLQAKKSNELICADGISEHDSVANTTLLINTSNEMRTPMNAIICMSDVGLDAKKASQKDQVLEQIGMSSRQVLRTIDNVLEMSKLKFDDLHLCMISGNLWCTLRDVIRANLPHLNAKRHDFSFFFDSRIPISLIYDAQYLTQVVDNLLCNAIDFTSDGGKIKLSASLVKNEDLCVIRIEVQDNGAGVNKAQLDNILASFKQKGANNATHFGGTGLGLVICKRLVELMGGEIYVVSAPEHGSTFGFTLTLNEVKDSMLTNAKRDGNYE